MEINNFEATWVEPNSISITTNTTWEAYAVGNFQLSEYNGKYNSLINIALPEDINEAIGYVYFRYGDEKCIYPSIHVNYTNPCYIETNYLFRQNHLPLSLS